MKKTLIVVDMQKDFVNGALGSKESMSIIDNVINKINMFLHNIDDATIWHGDTLAFPGNIEDDKLMKFHNNRYLVYNMNNLLRKQLAYLHKDGQPANP